MRLGILAAAALLVLWTPSGTAASPKIVSHPPLHPLHAPVKRSLGTGPSYFVDSAKGDDRNSGAIEAPWKTIGHAMPRLVAGDTLYLREGVLHENVYCSVVGKKEAPITIRSYPGELVILDGSMPEFLKEPEKAWVPYPEGAPGEYRSARRYRNIRDVVGTFGDSNIGLQTYWHAADLRAENELWINDPEKKRMVLPVYCGPGLWYDKESGFIHVRLAHTSIQKNVAADLPTPQVADYAGETDPRKVPLVVAPFSSSPLTVDQAMHVRFTDLVIRGGGYNTVVLQFGVDLDFDNVTIFAGTYGIRARNTGPLRFTHSAVYGMIPPWAWRNENCLYTFNARLADPFLTSIPKAGPEVPGAARGAPAAVGNERNIARMPTHALIVTEGFEESSVFAYPFNHDWEVSYSEFADSHDGVYFNGNSMRFHHNWVDNMQDDAIYLSSPTPYVCDNMWFYQNLITRCVSAFGCHSRGGPTGSIYVLRNVVDMRLGALFERPSPQRPKGRVQGSNFFLVHGYQRLGIESIYFYQNTVLANRSSYAYAHRMLGDVVGKSVRRVFNNLCVYLDEYPDPAKSAERGSDVVIDGNLHWCADPAANPSPKFLADVRECESSRESKKSYPPGWEANSIVADPKFVRFSRDRSARNDYRLQPDSPAAGAGIPLPSELEDPVKLRAGSRPDIGALPLGSEPLGVGIRGRIVAGVAGAIRD